MTRFWTLYIKSLVPDIATGAFYLDFFFVFLLFLFGFSFFFFLQALINALKVYIDSPGRILSFDNFFFIFLFQIDFLLLHSLNFIFMLFFFAQNFSENYLTKNISFIHEFSARSWKLLGGARKKMMATIIKNFV